MNGRIHIQLGMVFEIKSKLNPAFYLLDIFLTLSAQGPCLHAYKLYNSHTFSVLARPVSECFLPFSLSSVPSSQALPPLTVREQTITDKYVQFFTEILYYVYGGAYIQEHSNSKASSY